MTLKFSCVILFVFVQLAFATDIRLPEIDIEFDTESNQLDFNQGDKAKFQVAFASEVEKIVKKLI